MAKTNYQIFNEANDPERTYNDSEYKEATQRVGGVIPGMALSRMHNKMYYQWSAMCKAIANLIVKQGHDCMDSDVEGITNHLEEAIASAATGILDEHRTKTPMDHPPKSVTGDHIADGVIEKKHLTAAMMSVISDAGIAILGRNKTYAVGDIAYHKALPSWARLECVRAGTTAGSMPNLAAVSQCGVMITDGSVVWIVDDLRDGTPVGMVRGSLYVPAGYVKANGAVVQRADYPRLVALADRYRLWTSDVPRDPGLFGRADGSTIMTLPNWIDRMVQLSECNNGTEIGWAVEAGLPNITGQFAFQEDNATQSQGYGFARVNSATGAFQGIKRESWHRMLSANVLTDEDGDTSIKFNASKSNPIYGQSNTVQPAAIQLIPIIKY